VPTVIEKRAPRRQHRLVGSAAMHPARWLMGFVLICLAGCGEPSVREYKNRGELEAVLAAVSLRNAKELARDATRIGDRHASGELSDAFHKELSEIVELARRGDWAGAEKRAYEIRDQPALFK
jgi:hypothetical protein